jgi:hypothetical protein
MRIALSPYRALCAIAMLAALGLPSCFLSRSDTNEPLAPDLFRKLRPGTTRAKEAVEILGAPTEVVELGQRSAYRYDATTLKRAGFTVIVLTMLGEDQRQDRAWLFFDTHDVLTHYATTFGVHRTQYALPWEDVHEDADNAARDAERPGLLQPLGGATVATPASR